jgi:hypothetical protein
VSDGQDLIGIVTDRDIVVRCIAEGVDPNETAVSAACTVGVGPSSRVHRWTRRPD